MRYETATEVGVANGVAWSIEPRTNIAHRITGRIARRIDGAVTPSVFARPVDQARIARVPDLYFQGALRSTRSERAGASRA